MYRMSHLYGCVPGYGNFNRPGRQVCNRSDKMHFVRYVRGGMPGCGDCPRRKIIYVCALRGHRPRFFFNKQLQIHKFCITINR